MKMKYPSVPTNNTKKWTMINPWLITPFCKDTWPLSEEIYNYVKKKHIFLIIMIYWLIVWGLPHLFMKVKSLSTCVFVLLKNVRDRAIKTAHQIFTGILGTLAKHEKRVPACPSVLQSGHRARQSPLTVMHLYHPQAPMQAQKALGCRRYLQVTLMVASVLSTVLNHLTSWREVSLMMQL